MSWRGCTRLWAGDIEGATAMSVAAHLDLVFEDVQMLWFDGPDDGSHEPVVVPIRRVA